jgi:hypothetical protein
MLDLNDNKKTFNLPTYINIPYFLYHDNRLEKSATLIAAFFYSLQTSGLTIKASTDYLCQLANVDKRQYYRIMNQLEEYQYIKRSGFTNRKKIYWVYSPKSSITVVENETSVTECTSVQELNTSVMDDSKLVSSMTLNLCHPCHTDIKEDTKENKCVGANATNTQVSSKKSQKELAEYKALNNESIQTLFREKFSGLDITLEQLFSACKEHYEQKSLWATCDKFLKWIKSEKIENYKKSDSKNQIKETDEQRMERYRLERERNKRI